MKLINSYTSGEPIHEQIKNQIRSAILSGELTDGETLPSLRTLARELHVSVLTITRSYGELADEGPLAWRGLRMFGPRGRNRTFSVQSRRGAS